MTKDSCTFAGLNAGNDTYRTHCDWGDPDDLVVSVSTGITAVTDAEPPEFPPLEESIDANALCELFRPTPSGPLRSAGTVEFVHAECLVVVHATGKIVVTCAD